MLHFENKPYPSCTEIWLSWLCIWRHCYKSLKSCFMMDKPNSSWVYILLLVSRVDVFCICQVPDSTSGINVLWLDWYSSVFLLLFVLFCVPIYFFHLIEFDLCPSFSALRLCLTQRQVKYHSLFELKNISRYEESWTIMTENGTCFGPLMS